MKIALAFLALLPCMICFAGAAYVAAQGYILMPIVLVVVGIAVIGIKLNIWGPGQ